MPTQDLRRAGPGRARPAGAGSLRTSLARWIAFGGAAALSATGVYQMWLVISVGQVTGLEIAFLALFSITFAWVAFSAASAVAGLLIGGLRSPRRRRRGGEPPEGRPAGRTAVVMPVYNEDPAASMARLEAMAESLWRTGQGEAFEIFVLSDSTDPATAERERALAEQMRERWAGRIELWRRRRDRNTGRKAGNVRDFVERWGGRYDHMLVLDADSLMCGETMLELVRRMEAEPDLGLLQTTPQMIRGETLFARLQQFAAALYGPVASRAVAAWQGDDGNFWGHNALIRVRAFAEAAGLPELPGRPPFGGVIMSHDFVEAALLRRAGWRVRMDPDLGASWEESPPSFAEAATRDRRWAQGNLQHLRIIGARGLAWPNRAHFLIGASAYLMSPIWLALLICGFLLSFQASFHVPDYFPSKFQLFPTWPHFDSERMLMLLGVTLAALLAPKAIGLGSALLSRRRRRAHGGAIRLVLSAALELVVSALMAPMFMMAHCRHVAQILLGFDSGWSAQLRDGKTLSWSQALRIHRLDLMLGLAASAVALALSLGLFLWMSPVLVGLILAPALSRLSGDAAVGRALRWAGLLLTQAETETPALVSDMERKREECGRRLGAPAVEEARAA